ncbi:MAG: type VI secretion system contractile sheath small subunit [candidate division Zixibacteria bacterium]|nr:type VI secretion system contractile sheath small subunit [candidate division Zixibacteria bacterium]
MAQEGSVAPRERVNIVYQPSTGVDAEVELPLKMVVLGDFTQRGDDTPLEERKPINIDKDNFNEVMKGLKLSAEMSVKNALGEDENAQMPVKLNFDHVNDFGPEAVVRQVPELSKLLQLRTALTALKGPLGNVPGFRKKIMEIMGNDAAREKLLKELGIGTTPSA